MSRIMNLYDGVRPWSAFCTVRLVFVQLQLSWDENRSAFVHYESIVHMSMEKARGSALMELLASRGLAIEHLHVDVL